VKRTKDELLSSLLRFALDNQWSGQSWHKGDDWASCCPECEVLHYALGDYTHQHEQQHLPTCPLMLLIAETQAELGEKT
jgi:hypothetical protein